MWKLFAILSALFAALTAIFAKMGMKGMDSDLATAIRTVIILVLAWGIVWFKGGAGSMAHLSGKTGFSLSFPDWQRVVPGSSTSRPCRQEKYHR